MRIRTVFVSLSAAIVAMFATVACEIHTCEEGATCHEIGDWDGDQIHSECTSYCGRLSVCGAEQADDFDKCVDACQDRYKRLPDETHRLCACAPASSCSDVVEGRCSPPNQNGGGSGGSCNYCSSGGSPNGYPNGGAPAGGASYASGGSGTGLGGASAGGSAGNGSAGETSSSCQASCDCPSGQSCVSGHCVE